MLYTLAERLGRRIPELMDMTVTEFAGWVAYYRVVDKLRKQASK